MKMIIISVRTFFGGRPMRFYKPVLCLLLLLFILPTGVFAYSYGDPNQEELAEDFKQIVVKLNGSTPDWPGAQEIYKVRRAEIASHFGEDTAAVLDANFQAKDKDLLINNYKGLLVKNLERRFTYAEQGIKDYAQAKLLLAKAKATYETLQPYMKFGKQDEAAQISAAFDEALDALGNPGLFGVGEKAADPARFKAKVDFIYKTVSPQFPFTGASAGKQADNPSGANPGPAEHAPMERTNKTNPIVSVIVIGAVVVVVGGAFWFARRKGIF